MRGGKRRERRLERPASPPAPPFLSSGRRCRHLVSRKQREAVPRVTWPRSARAGRVRGRGGPCGSAPLRGEGGGVPPG